jgi:hypothetical protein
VIPRRSCFEVALRRRYRSYSCERRIWFAPDPGFAEPGPAHRYWDQERQALKRVGEWRDADGFLHRCLRRFPDVSAFPKLRTRRPTTNGYAGGMINKVKVIKCRAYGLPTFEGFRERVLVASG